MKNNGVLPSFRLKQSSLVSCGSIVAILLGGLFKCSGCLSFEAKKRIPLYILGNIIKPTHCGPLIIMQTKITSVYCETILNKGIMRL